MKTKIKFILVFCSLFFIFHLAHATPIINEIMYAPATGSDYEWVEIYNNGSDPVDLSNWRFFYSNQADSHPLTLQKGTDSILGAGEYAVIAKSPTYAGDYSWLNYSGRIFSATLSLNDNGNLIGIMDADKNIEDSVTYDPSLGGSKDSGTSLSLINGAWTAGVSTPGTENQISTSDNSTTDTTDTNTSSDENGSGSESESNGTTTSSGAATSSSSETNTSSGSASSSKSKTIVNPTIKAKIITKTLAYVGEPTKFKASILGYYNELLPYGKVFWNFGDGASLEQTNQFEEFNHIYYYPGEYIATLEYYQYSSLDPEATSSVTVKVAPITVSISKVGDENDFFIELSNNSTNEMDLSGWELVSADKVFILPKDSLLASNGQMTLSSKVTNFGIADKNSLKLMTSAGNLVFDYNNLSLSAETPVEETTPQAVEVQKTTVSQKTENPNPNDNLLADAGKSDINVGGSPRNSFWFFVAFGVLLVGSSGAVYFIRRKRITPKIGSDFEILDE